MGDDGCINSSLNLITINVLLVINSYKLYNIM